MIPYPANLPQPLDSLTGESATPVIRTDMDTGLVLQEGRFSTGRSVYQLTWKLDEAEKVVFEDWFNNTLAGGVLLFALQMLVDGGIDDVPARFIDGTYDVDHQAGTWFEISASVEVLLVTDAPANRTLPVPPWFRLELDEALSQTIGIGYRNARLITRPASGNLTTFRIPPPTVDTSFIWFGLQNFGAGEVLITSEDVDPLPVESIPAFPSTLPDVDNQFNEGAKRGTERLDMESGHTRQWSRFETTVKSFVARWEFSLEELQDFRDFFYTILKAGSKIFTLKLPVDGDFEEVQVRFVGGKFKESYVPVGRFLVTAELDQVVDQTVLPSELNPHPLYHSPIVNVYSSRKVKAADEMKMFNVYPAEGQTISLHISSGTMEFGITVKGLGNVLVTRGPFPVDIGGIGSDSTGTIMLKPFASLVDTIKNVGEIPTDTTGTIMLKPYGDLISVIEDVGAAPPDTVGTTMLKPYTELLTVLEDIGEIPTDTTGTTYLKPTLTLDIP